jgi:hypothetical protein
MDSEDEFNNFVLNELIDSPSSKDEEKFYSDVTNIIVQESLNEPRRGGSIVGHETVYGFRGTTYCIKIISQRTLDLVRDISRGD